MLNCKDTSKLVSESLDRQLSWRQRVGLWMHLSMCRLCSAFRKDLVHLHEETRQHAAQVDQDVAEADVKLPIEARKRIKRTIDSQRS